MQPAEATQALAKASAALVDDHDVSGFLASLLGQRPVRARMPTPAASSSLTVTALRCSQPPAMTPPSSSCIRRSSMKGPASMPTHSATPVEVSGAVYLARRWKVASARSSSRQASSSHTLHHFVGTVLRSERWGSSASTATPFTPEETVVAQAFADIADAAHRADRAGRPRRLHASACRTRLPPRVVIEQAKGVIAELEHVPMNRAYALPAGNALLSRARASPTPRARSSSARSAGESQWLRSALISSRLFLPE